MTHQAPFPLPRDIEKSSDAVKAHYFRMITAGESPRMAEMLALRRAPHMATDSDYFSSYGTLADQFEGREDELNLIVSAAKRKGYTPNINDVYEPSLANSIGDPAAFISPSGGRGQIRKVANERRVNVHGAVETSFAPEEPPPAVRMCPKLVEKYVNERIKENPDLAHKDRNELREQVIDKHAYKGAID